MGSRRVRAKTTAEVRRHQVKVRLNDVELGLVDGACDRSGMSRGQWVMRAVDAELGLGPGPGEVSERGELVLELMQARTALARIGNNLNQAVMALHSTGEVNTRQMRAVLDRVEAATEQVDQAALAVENRGARKRRVR